jgi:RHS repeat-associated protein
VYEYYHKLPGGTLLTIRSNQKIYSLPNIHGDVMTKATNNGSLTNSPQYEPFGKPLSNPSTPDNVTAKDEYAWLGQYQKVTDTLTQSMFVQMGVRLYAPTLGRFAQVDPVEGGVQNNYVYPADPVNSNDLTGMWVAHVWAPSIINQVIQADKLIPGGFRDGGSRYVASILAAKTSISLTPAKLDSIKIGRVSPTLRAGGPREIVHRPSNWSRLHHGLDSGSSYSSAGQLAGGGFGCAAGAAFAGVGCLVGGPIGWRAGGIIGFGVGFYYGWTGSEKAENFDGGPWYTPSPF